MSSGLASTCPSHNVDVASQVGRTLRIFDWTGVTPTGQSAIRSRDLWDTTNLYTTGEVKLVAVPEPSAAASFMIIGVLSFAACCRFRPGKPSSRTLVAKRVLTKVAM